MLLFFFFSSLNFELTMAENQMPFRPFTGINRNRFFLERERQLKLNDDLLLVGIQMKVYLILLLVTLQWIQE